MLSLELADVASNLRGRPGTDREGSPTGKKTLRRLDGQLRLAVLAIGDHEIG